MTREKLRWLLESICAEFGVTPREARFGTAIRTSAGHGGQLSVSLCRHLFLYRAWQGGALASQAAGLLGIHARSALFWFKDFRVRQQQQGRLNEKRGAA